MFFFLSFFFRWNIIIEPRQLVIAERREKKKGAITSGFLLALWFYGCRESFDDCCLISFVLTALWPIPLSPSSHDFLQTRLLNRGFSIDVIYFYLFFYFFLLLIVMPMNHSYCRLACNYSHLAMLFASFYFAGGVLEIPTFSRFYWRTNTNHCPVFIGTIYSQYALLFLCMSGGIDILIFLVSQSSRERKKGNVACPKWSSPRVSDWNCLFFLLLLFFVLFCFLLWSSIWRDVKLCISGSLGIMPNGRCTRISKTANRNGFITNPISICH